MRFKTVRGFKSAAGMLAGVALTQWLYSGAEVHDLRELVAWGWRGQGESATQEISKVTHQR